MIRSLLGGEKDSPKVKLSIHLPFQWTSLKGKVVCEVLTKEPIQGEPIHLAISGKEVACTKVSGKRKESERSLGRMRVDLKEFCDRRLGPGRIYTFPFALKLPRSLPASCSFKNGDVNLKVEYKIIASGYSASKERGFTVTSATLPDEHVPCLQRPVSQPVKSLNVMDQGLLTLAAKVKDTHVGRGDRIQVSLSCRNHSLVDIQRIELKVQEIVAGDVIASREGNFGATRTFKQDIYAKKDLKLNGMHSSAAATAHQVKRALSWSAADREKEYATIYQELSDDTFMFEFLCPESARDSYKGKLIHVKHQIKIRLMTNSVTDNPSIVIPLKIGNPLKTRASASPPRAQRSATMNSPSAPAKIGATSSKVQPVWCWKETRNKTFDGMKNHDPSEICGDPEDCWIIYDNNSSAMLEQAHQAGKIRCKLNNDYFVDLSTMTQTKKKTGFQRKVQRIVPSTSTITTRSPRRAMPGPDSASALISLRHLEPLLPPTPTPNQQAVATLDSTTNSHSRSQSSSDLPPSPRALEANQSLETNRSSLPQTCPRLSSHLRQQLRQQSVAPPPAAMPPAPSTPSAPPAPSTQSAPVLPPPPSASTYDEITASAPTAMAVSYSTSASPHASAPPAQFTQSAPVHPRHSAPALPASAPPPTFTQSTPVLPRHSAPTSDRLSASTSSVLVQPSAPFAYEEDLPFVTATPVPIDAINAPTTVIDSDFVVLGGDAILLDEEPSGYDSILLEDVTRPPQDPPVNLPPSVDRLYEEMLVSVDDYDIIRTKLQNQSWRFLFGGITSEDFGGIIARVNIDQDQPRVAALLAPVLNGGNKFICEYCAAAVRTTVAWNRPTMVERLVPSCVDLRENYHLIWAELNEWDQIIAARILQPYR